MFSSSSSSDCDCGECCNYGAANGLGCNGNSYKIPWKTPFYPAMGNPLIYYSQVPSLNRPQRRQRKRNGNCFVKAFRWYTQEHVPQRNKISPENQVMTDFAAWLDTKYYQFLRNSQVDQTKYQIKLKQTSTIEANRISSNSRRKRRRQSKNGGDTYKKSNQSLHYILPPKEITHPTSEYCQPTITSCCNQSHGSVASSGAQNSKRTLAKSQSLACSCHEKGSDAIPIPVHGGSTKYEDKGKSEKIYAKPTAVPKISADGGAVDASCQCFEEITRKVDKYTQYDVSRTSSWKHEVRSVEGAASIASSLQVHNKSLSKIEYLTSVKRETNTRLLRESGFKANTSCQCSVNIKVDAQCQYEDEGASTPKNSTPIVDTCSCSSKHATTGSSISPKAPTVPKTSRSFVTFTNAVQTSDHSITLEENVNHKYPLFLKIVCADKLCEEHCKL